ncbi:cupin domain-containing protein [Patulibacter defluvii]|uniref:cupin domain-containing protein n=1 Tax=Patulibacter defluvii TaxID=3095358 RepID=UPI002A748793|nr:cupin domain-containing protein [Patulibacter sp. DM4]
MLLQDPDTTTTAEPAGALGSWLPEPGQRAGRFEGEELGSAVSCFVVDTPPGEGPALHLHPYSETFVVEGGRARFELDGLRIDAVPGDVVVVAPETPHRFTSIGAGHLRMVCIHVAPRMATTWL